MTALFQILAAFAVAVVAASFFEWSLHRFLMHGVWLRGYPYRAHDLVHHVVFDDGAGYHLRNEADRAIVTMAWWNGPLLLLVCAVPCSLGALIAGSWWVLLGAMLAFVAYYGAYEYLHFCMHVPKRRALERSRLFRWIDRHHRIHHLHPMTNVNVVLPIADWVLGTILGPRGLAAWRPEATATVTAAGAADTQGTKILI